MDEFHCSTVICPQALVTEDQDEARRGGEGPGLGRRGAEPPTCESAMQHENWLGAEGGRRWPGAEGEEARSSGGARDGEKRCSA